MGVNIPNNDFSCVDVLRELERVRENLADKMRIANPLMITGMTF